MQFTHTELLHKEAVRLLSQQIGLLEKITGTKELLTDSSENQKKSLDVSTVKEDIDVLKGELIKLENLDMVLTVVGTMKSGKSTTNNAIVGLEIFPNRNLPMTALPTLVRHTPGQTLPKLKFEKNQPINQLIDKIRSYIDTPESLSKLDEEGKSDNLIQVAQDIQDGLMVKNQYDGESGIFEFLKQLNDLVRLTAALDLNFPFDEFTAINDFPVIEVEFEHLRGNKTALGRLSILDTPGPNEEGQFALRDMMSEQIKRASGVIAVLDYTQLKSDSDAEVRRELIDIAGMAKGRLSVFVNKFDQKDYNSDGESAIKSLVAKELFRGRISEDDVYPISSRYAFLANRARTEIALNSRLPNHEESLWIQDFAEKGLGRRWRQSIDDLERVNEAIEGLWEDSLFELPLSRVIKRAHDQAAILAIDSAASKLVENGNRVNNYLGLRQTALNNSSEQLQKYIQELISQIQKTEELEKSSQENLNLIGKKIARNFIELVNLARSQLKDSIEEYFSQGKIVAIAASSVQDDGAVIVRDNNLDRDKNMIIESTDLLGNFVRFFSYTKNKRYVKSHIQHFDPNEDIIEFTNKDEAKDLLDNINNATGLLYERVNNALINSIDLIHKEMEKQYPKIELKAKEILDDLSSSLSDQGFELKLKLPIKPAVSIETDRKKILDNMIAIELKNQRFSRHSSNIWGKVCNYFDTSDWGRETYFKEVTYYKVDIKALRSKAINASEKVFSDVNKSIDHEIIKPVEESFDYFFSELKLTIDKTRGDLLEGLDDKRRTEQEQLDLSHQLANLRSVSSVFDGDIEGLEKESKLILRKSGALLVTDNQPDMEPQA